MAIPLNKGGVLSTTPEGLPWIEEYPGQPTSHVLNGFMFSVIGLLETEIVSGQKIEGLDTNQLVNSLLNSFPIYVAGKYLKYDRLHKSLCNPHYSGLQVLLLYHLFKLTSVDQFLT